MHDINHADENAHMIIYKGPSMIDGAPIVVLVPLTRKSKNAKTGALLQTYILRADVSPVEAIRTALDASICGTCRHRGDVLRAGSPGKGRTCYVNVGQGAQSTWTAFVKGRHADISGNLEAIAQLGKGRLIRLGTYGDPAAVPSWVWEALLSQAIGHTGYTHQWATLASASALRGMVMASADSVQEAQVAHDAGWRTFRVRMPHESGRRMRGEAQCPAAKEVGARVQCADCMACDGSQRSRAIDAHGGSAVMSNVRRIDALQVA